MSFQRITVQDFSNHSCVYNTSLPTSSIVAANANPLRMSDVRRVFDGKRVVFAGDSAVRAIYRDMATFIVTGHRLCSSQIAIQNGEKLTPWVNERRVRAGGRVAMPDYVDERICQWSPSSSIHYIYLSSLNSQESNELLRLVQGADMLILLSVRGDMNQKMIENSPISFSEHLNVYASNVLSLCRCIVDVTRSSSSSDISPLLLWLTPLPFSTITTQEQKNQFLQIVAAGENSAKNAGFQLFDQLNISLADGGGFTNHQGGRFSSIGIRLLSTLLAKTAAEHWQRSVPLPVCSSSSSPVPLVIDTTAVTSCILDDNRAR